MQVHQLDHVSFLCDLKPEAYNILEVVYSKYQNMELKGQQVTKKALQSLVPQKPDCPASKFKCLRGDLLPGEIVSLLDSVKQGSTNLAEMEKEACRIKELREVQRCIIKEIGAAVWSEAVKR